MRLHARPRSTRVINGQAILIGDVVPRDGKSLADRKTFRQDANHVGNMTIILGYS